MKIILRLPSDLTTKSDKIRARFVTRLVKNLKAAFSSAGIEAKIQRDWSRLFVDTEDRRALDLLGRIFGIASYSPVDRITSGKREDIVAAAAEAFTDHVAGKSFAVRARRVGKHDYTSMDLQKAIGAVLWPHARKVDLHRPEALVYVEVREDVAYLYHRQLVGAGGLPLGASGRVLCLMSGGFDSAVAAWMLMKRGVEVDYLFCNLAGGAYERSVLSIAKLLHAAWSHGSKSTLHVMDFTGVADMIKGRCRPAHAQVVLKRQFYRSAEALAGYLGAGAIVTGEAIGQVASQTLPNLGAIEQPIRLPIFRPLIGFDKEEIIRLARRIGTYDLSAKVQEYCQLVPDRPVTATTAARLDLEEAPLDEAVRREALHERKVIPLHAVGEADLVTPYLFVDVIPDGAVVIDCRESHHYEDWHHPGALNIELAELLTAFKRLDKARTYLLYCPVGLQSAVAAEQMQKAGWTAYSLRGGMRRLEIHPIA